MHVGCGFGGLTGLETGALGRQEISRTSVTLGGAFLASRQGDHRTSLLDRTQRSGKSSSRERLGQSAPLEIQLERRPQLQPCSLIYVRPPRQETPRPPDALGSGEIPQE